MSVLQNRLEETTTGREVQRAASGAGGEGGTCENHALASSTHLLGLLALLPLAGLCFQNGLRRRHWDGGASPPCVHFFAGTGPTAARALRAKMHVKGAARSAPFDWRDVIRGRLEGA